MAFPSNSKLSLKTVWDQIKDTSGRIKNVCNVIASAPSITRKSALDFSNLLADSLQSLDVNTTNAGTNGLLSYARAQENDVTLDLIATYNTMRTQIVATQDWLVTNFPKAVDGNLVVYTFDVNKRFVDINLTAPQLSTFKAQVAALSATID